MDDEANRQRQRRNNIRLAWLLAVIALVSMAITMYKGAGMFESGYY